MLSIESWHVDKRLVQGQEKAQKNRPTQWGEEQQLAAGRLKNTQDLHRYVDRSTPTVKRNLQTCANVTISAAEQHSEAAK